MSKEYTRDIRTIGLIPVFGNILLFDTFDNISHWIPTSNDTYTFRRSISTNLFNPTPLYMKTRVSGAAIGDFIRIQKKIYAPVASLLLFQIYWLCVSSSKLDTITFYPSYQDGSNSHTFGIKYDQTNQKYQYLNSMNVYTDIPSGSQKLLSNSWNLLQFSVNLITSKYISFTSNNLKSDLSNLSYYKDTNVGAPYTNIYIKAITKIASPLEIFVDSIALTN